MHKKYRPNQNGPDPDRHIKIPRCNTKHYVRDLFNKKARHRNCIPKSRNECLPVKKLDYFDIKIALGFYCSTIEHQFIKLRGITQLKQKDYLQRSQFTRMFLNCLERHHGRIYEGVLFGSTINGLGFRDSDVDLRLRYLRQVGEGLYEPVPLDDDMIGLTLRNIAFTTNICCPAKGCYVPSIRCPVAKLKLFYEPGPRQDPVEGLNFDISLSAKNSLGSFNSLFLKFLCDLQPKFHLLATALRYWSKCHELIQPGDLSSYALINMLIFFCQTTQPPLLPTVDQMRQVHLDNESEQERQKKSINAITQLDWHCIISMDKNLYSNSENREPLSLLLLKFFEFYLNFPFKTHVITIRPGRALEHQEFMSSTQYHPRFPIKKYVNIQDPFDLKHNLTSGLEGQHFNLLMVVIRHSYERLHHEIMNNFYKPVEEPIYFPNNPNSTRSPEKVINGNSKSQTNGEKPSTEPVRTVNDRRDWGLNVIFNKLTPEQLKDS